MHINQVGGEFMLFKWYRHKKGKRHAIAQPTKRHVHIVGMRLDGYLEPDREGKELMGRRLIRFE